MKFENFEKQIWKRGYGIAALNHYFCKTTYYTYCAIFNKNEKRGLAAEDTTSEKVFDTLFEQLKKMEEETK